MLTMYFSVGLPMRKRVTRSYERLCATEANYSRICDSECACSGDYCGCHGCVNTRRSCRRKKTDSTVFLVIISLILSTHVAMTTANIMGDECDWFGR